MLNAIEPYDLGVYRIIGVPSKGYHLVYTIIIFNQIGLIPSHHYKCCPTKYFASVLLYLVQLQTSIDDCRHKTCLNMTLFNLI